MPKDTIILPANIAKTAEVRKWMDEIRGWFGSFEIKLTEAHNEAVQRFFTQVVEYTPKKTGYASYNWRMSPTGNLNNSLEPRVEVEGHYTGTVELPDFDSIRWNSNTHVYNFVPYIEMINNGYSNKHPHFFEHAKADAESYLNSKIRSI